MKSKDDSITYGRTSICFKIERTARRKTIGVTVEPNASVRVSVPKGTRHVRVVDAVRKKAKWILEQQERFRRLNVSYPREFVSGETFYYLGRQYTLKVQASSPNGSPIVKLYGGRLCVLLPVLSDEDKQVQVRGGLICWYRDHARTYLPTLLDSYCRMLGSQYRTLRIVDFKKRWASTSVNGTIRISWRIMMAPRRILTYVVAHEVCHLIHPSHSPVFWRTLQRLLPGYVALKNELEQIGPTFVW